MSAFPAEVRELVLSNYPLILAALAGYFAVFLLISYAAKRRLAPEAADYIVASATWSRASTEAALTAPAVGIGLTFAWELSLLPNPVPIHILPGFATAFFINVLLFILISYMTRPQPPEQVDRFHGLIAREL